MIAIRIKPLSVNEAWQGKRYKTDCYKAFERELMLKLPAIEIPDGYLRLDLEFGFSNRGSDLSNPIKLVEDVLQKKYGFNDNRIYEIFARKKKTDKGGEYIMFNISSVE